MMIIIIVIATIMILIIIIKLSLGQNNLSNQTVNETVSFFQVISKSY